MKTMKIKEGLKDGECAFFREYWSGDSRDGILVNGDGYHFYKIRSDGLIIEAYEYYELEDGREHVCILPEMINVGWFKDLGFEDTDVLDPVEEYSFAEIREKSSQKTK